MSGKNKTTTTFFLLTSLDNRYRVPTFHSNLPILDIWHGKTQIHTEQRILIVCMKHQRSHGMSRGYIVDNSLSIINYIGLQKEYYTYSQKEPTVFFITRDYQYVCIYLYVTEHRKREHLGQFNTSHYS